MKKCFILFALIFGMLNFSAVSAFEYKVDNNECILTETLTSIQNQKFSVKTKFYKPKPHGELEGGRAEDFDDVRNIGGVRTRYQNVNDTIYITPGVTEPNPDECKYHQIGIMYEFLKENGKWHYRYRAISITTKDYKTIARSKNSVDKINQRIISFNPKDPNPTPYIANYRPLEELEKTIVEACQTHRDEWNAINEKAADIERKKAEIDKLFNELVKKGDALYEEQKYLAALEDYKTAATMRNNDSKLQDKIWKVYTTTKNNYNDAVKFYGALTKANPKNDTAYFRLGYSYDELGNYDAAISAYQNELSLNPKDSAGYNNLGNVYFKLQRYDEAIENFKNALYIESDDETAFNNLWNAYFASKKFNDAVEFYTQRVENNKNDSASWFRLGWSLNELKNYPESIEAIQKSIKLKPTANSYYWLARVYENSNNTKKAVSALKKSLELNPNYEDAKNLLAKLTAKK